MPYSDMQLADAFIQTGELDDALQALDRHLTTQPHDMDARRLRAEVRARSSEVTMLTGALEDIEAIPTPTPTDIILRSVLLERMGKQDEALTVTQQGHQTDHSDDRLTERLLYLLRSAGRVSEARQIVAELPANSWRWQQWAGDLADDAKDDEAAIRHYTECITLLETTYDQLGAVDSSDQTSTEPALQGVYARLLLARASVAHRAGDFTTADADYKRAQHILPDDPTIGFNRGIIAHQRGDVETAVNLCRNALQQASITIRTYLLEHTSDDLHTLIES